MARILVVDDDALLRECLCDILTESGHEVRSADNGQSCIEALEAAKPDMVLIDLFMPVKDGISAIMDIRNRHPDVRIIAMSGGASMLEGGGYLKVARALGAEKALNKPFACASLLQAVGDMQLQGA